LREREEHKRKGSGKFLGKKAGSKWCQKAEAAGLEKIRGGKHEKSELLSSEDGEQDNGKTEGGSGGPEEERGRQVRGKANIYRNEVDKEHLGRQYKKVLDVAKRPKEKGGSKQLRKKQRRGKTVDKVWTKREGLQFEVR